MYSSGRLVYIQYLTVPIQHLDSVRRLAEVDKRGVGHQVQDLSGVHCAFGWVLVLWKNDM